MKLTALLCVFFLFFSKRDTAQVIDCKNITAIRIEYVDVEVTTPINVNCEKFNRYFQSGIKKCTISIKKDIEGLCFEFNSFIKSAKEYNEVPDVRVKFIFLKGRKIYKTVCYSSLLTSVGDKNFVNTDKIRTFVEKLIETRNNKVPVD